MKAFEFAGPGNVVAALKALSGAPDAAVLAGGTDLLNRMKDYVTSPSRVVYVKEIKEISGISGDPSTGIAIGAGATLADVVAHGGISEAYPALHQAAAEVGTPQIRNMATVGGNLLQRPRCWFYRTGNGLLGMRNGKSLVREGDNRYHAVFLTDGDALYVNPSSLATALVALDATAEIAGPDGRRTIPVAELYRIPTTSEESEFTLKPGELLAKVTVPPAKGSRNATYEIRQKQSHDWPLVLASVNLSMNGATVNSARVVLYGVAPIPYRSEAAEKALAGKTLDAAAAEAAGEAATTGAKPLSMNGYKIPLIRTAVKRALLAAVGDRYWEA